MIDIQVEFVKGISGINDIGKSGTQMKGLPTRSSAELDDLQYAPNAYRDFGPT